MTKIVIISSFREACGPAAHTTYLKKALEYFGFDVEVAKLDVSLMRSTSRLARRRVRQEISRILLISNQADGVVLQIEPGLYGPAPWIAYGRINKILDGIKVKVLSVLHGWDKPSAIYEDFLGLIKEALSPFSKDYRRYYFSRIALRLHPSYGGFLNRLRKSGVVCFSRADIHELEFYGIKNSTYVPISYLLQHDINDITSGATDFRKKICHRLNIDVNKKIIIAPGFINTYKNTIATLDSLQYLSDEYHLIIAGGLHPHSSQINSALFELLKAKGDPKAPRPSFIPEPRPYKATSLAVKRYPRDLRNRIHFVGSLNDDDLNNWIAAADYVVLPYLDTVTGQSGSGPFALAIEIGKQSFFGSAGVFRSQDYVSSTSSFTFDSTNPAELAYCLQNAQDDKEHYDAFVKKFRNSYNAESQVSSYLTLLGLNDAKNTLYRG